LCSLTFIKLPDTKCFLLFNFYFLIFKVSELIIYTDGAARGNPGPGGYGAVLHWGDVIKEISQGYKHTTNNRMELMAVIAALQLLKRDNLNVTIYSDSAYVVNSVEKKWVFGWAKKGFADKKNADLWMRFLEHYKRNHIRFVWVKGHASNKWNNRCDILATTAADGKNLLEDVGYVKGGG
jgi:ribonuclease HI